MRVLLDTQAFLWFVLADARLSDVAKNTIVNPVNQIHVSPASYWEIAIKISLGKYQLNEPFESFMHRGIQGNGFTVLPVGTKHAASLLTLPFHHRDPFDRLLAAQAIVESVPLVSVDADFDGYGVTRIW